MSGLLVTGIKYISLNAKNPGLAAILGGFPIGLASIYFLKETDTLLYAKNYFFITLVTSASIAFFYFLKTHTKLSKNTVLAISFVAWVFLASLNFILK